MTRHTMHVKDRQGSARVEFELREIPWTDGKMVCVAPGLIPFRVASLDEARDVIRSAYTVQART